MSRRLVLGLTALGLTAAGTGIAAAAPTDAPLYKHQVCVVTSSDPNHGTTKDFCVSWSAPQR